MMHRPILQAISLFLIFLCAPATAFGGTVKRTSLQVGNLSCSSCLAAIAEELTGLPGAIGMTGAIRAGIIIVDHNRDLDSEIIARVITAKGYPAAVDWTADIDEQNAFTFNNAGRVASGCGGGCNQSGSTASGPRLWNPEARQAGPTRRTTMQVQNLTCSSCLTSIATELKGMTGTIGMTGDLDKGIVVVEHLDSLAAATVAAAISRLGYPTRISAAADNDDGRQNKAAFGGRPASETPANGANCSRRSCNATASAWKKLYRRYISNRSR